jgi:phenylalanyl-tRNA synthetase beta chain
MRVVWSWLLELCELPAGIGPEEAARALTGAGLEVEDLGRLGEGFSGVVVAEVVGKRKHPQADRLTLVDVIDRPGGLATEVVCGAANVPEPGGRVLWARPGAVLPGGVEVGTRALKGVVSAGMLCSERELGLGEDHDGIVVLGGRAREVALATPAQDALGLRDTVLEVGVPANRPDALGHRGIARELAALVGGRLRPIDADLGPVTDERLAAAALVDVVVEDRERCPRYTARVIDGVKVAPSPDWMRRRLEAVGVRPLSNLIDITNYVMFELGQPLHAFDCARVGDGPGHKKQILVRRARAGESMTTLDEIQRALGADDLLICDPRGGVAIAGVMGGAGTEVGATTERVLLESATFAPAGIRRTARRLALQSESSYRFERGVDPGGADVASARAAKLMAQIAGGRVARGVVDTQPVAAPPRRVWLRPGRAAALSGLALDAARIRAMLAAIEIEVAREPRADGALQVACPSFRVDLLREVDLIEEVIRLHGIDEVPVTLPSAAVVATVPVDDRTVRARRALVAAGLCESIHYGFIAPQAIAALDLPPADPRATPIPVANPLSADGSVMRTTLLPGLLGRVAYNLARGSLDVRLGEVGAIFLPRGAACARKAGRDAALPDERRAVGGVLCGTWSRWLSSVEPVDFFVVRGVVERIVRELGGPAARACFRQTDAVPFLHPGVAATVEREGAGGVGAEDPCGWLGEVHPTTRHAFAIAVPCFAFELDLARLGPATPAQMTAVPRYPAVTRDVSFFVDVATPADRVRAVIADAREPLLCQIEVREDYRDSDRVPAGKKGMLWSVTYQSLERTLTDVEVDAAHEAIVKRLLAELAAKRR